jgi:hypothetical protein
MSARRQIAELDVCSIPEIASSRAQLRKEFRDTTAISNREQGRSCARGYARGDRSSRIENAFFTRFRTPYAYTGLLMAAASKSVPVSTGMPDARSLKPKARCHAILPL